MRYLVRAKVKAGKKKSLLRAIREKSLGRGSIAGDEYLRDMHQARELQDGTVRWVEVCYCPVPLEEEQPYWEEYFELIRIQDAYDRRRCRDLNGQEPWACNGCDCTQRLEAKMNNWGKPFLKGSVKS
ncbi:MAG: hypothetical protein U0V70_10335 [Terriglobia bacterium]